MIQDFLLQHNFNLIQILIVTIGYLMPIPLSIAALRLWHHYRQENFIVGIKWALLEVQVPRDVIKSPAAMELIFSNAFYQKSMKGFWEQYIQGAPWFWFSLEMVSIDGNVHFFIRTPTRMRDLVETQIYAQYPQAKVVEVDDYTLHIPQYKKNGDWDVWGCEFNKLHEDFLPIRTYRDMEEMDSGTKEEYKIDPITPTIELLGSLPRGQQLWIQIIIRQNIKQYHSHHTGKHVDFYQAAQEFMIDYLKPYSRTQKYESSPNEFGFDVRTPDPVKPVIKAITDNVGLIHFDCGIRVIALSNKKLCTDEQFNNLRRASRLIWRQYAQPNINELNRINSTQFDAPWSDPTGLALTKYKKRSLDFYRMRTFFHPPIQYSIDYPRLLASFFPSGSPKIFVMSSRELATIFHFPGMVSETPSFKRIESKIAKPPSNLPI
ncbi:MAG: hypothetical protein KGI58_03005 [Patescibacteria group bacterium]|nr:hypothetical protein [Patescibacteria group bacterium]